MSGKRTKICIIEKCQYFKGTKLKIPMFRIPKEEIILNRWKEILGPHLNSNYLENSSLNGMVCINHFNSNHLTPSNNLIKGALPSIFPSTQAKEDNKDMQNELDNPDHLIEPIEQNECCELIRSQLQGLREEHSRLKLNNEIQFSKLQKKIHDLESKIKTQTDQIKTMFKKIVYKDGKIENLEKNLKESQENQLTEHTKTTLEKIEKDEVLACLINGIKSGTKYPEKLRKLCFSINYHSLAAYKIFRKQFNNNAPHPKTLVSWLGLSDLNGEPGIREENFNRLKKFVEGLKGEPLVCGLIFDEISIRQQIYWDEQKMHFVGLPTYGHGCTDTSNTSNVGNVDQVSKANVSECADADQEANENDELETIETMDKSKKDKMPMAKKALNFMLSGINKSFKFPIVYHFVDKLNAQQLQTLVSEIIFKISECGVTLKTITFDGDPKNLAMCKLFGANFDVSSVSSQNFKPFFENPFDKSRIYVILDPSHMEKLMRNLLGHQGVFFDNHDNGIKWKYFVELHKVCKEKKLTTHKLNRKHIEFDRNIQKTSLAIETFSQSVADSMEIMRQENHKEFVDCEATIQFILKMDKLFNIFNSRNNRNSNIFKCPLSNLNKRIIYYFIDECISFLKSLQIMVKRKRNNRETKIKLNILDTINKTPVLGFIIDLNNLRLFYEECVENKMILDKIITYTFSQDHIEIFHSKIRARNGHNSNPNVVQYKGAYRRILCDSDIRAPESANCMILDVADTNSKFIPESNIYFISSRRPKFNIMEDEKFINNLAIQRTQILNEFNELDKIEAIESSKIDGLAGASIAYTARLIEKKIETQDFYCDCCKLIFEENQKLIDPSIHIIHSNRPCSSTFNICKITDSFIKLYKPKFLNAENSDNSSEKDFRVIYYLIFKEIDFSNLFQQSNFIDHEGHLFHLVRCIIKEYIRIKMSQVSKQITLNHYDTLLRSKFTNLIHLSGQ